MPPDSPPPSGGVRRFFKRVKKVFKPSGQAPASHVPSTPPQAPTGDPLPQPGPSRAPTPTLVPQLPAGSQQAAISPQSAPSPSQPPPTALPSVANSDQPANTESSLALAKKAGAYVWRGLKIALPVIKECSGAFPPLQAAVGGLMEVANAVEVSNTIICVLTYPSFGSGCRELPRTGRTTRSSTRNCKLW